MKKRVFRTVTVFLLLALCTGTFGLSALADESAPAAEVPAGEEADPESGDVPEESGTSKEGQEEENEVPSGDQDSGQKEEAAEDRTADRSAEELSGDKSAEVPAEQTEEGQEEENENEVLSGDQDSGQKEETAEDRTADRPAEDLSGDKSAEVPAEQTEEGQEEETEAQAFVPGDAGTLYADDVNKHIPKNVRVQLLGEETDSSGQTYVIAEVSWDADSTIIMSEMHPFIGNMDIGAAEFLLNKEWGGQSIIRRDVQGEGIPENMRYTVENARNRYRVKIPKLRPGESPFYQDGQGRIFAKGVNEDGHAVIMLQSAVNTSQGWQYTDYSNPVGVDFTKANISGKKTFQECVHGQDHIKYESNGNGTHASVCSNCLTVLQENVKCTYEWVNTGDPHQHDIYCKYCKYKRGRMMHFFRTRSKDGLVEEYCACGYSNVTQETFDEKKQPGVTQIKWDKEKGTFPSTVKLPADADPEKAKLVAWENDDSVSKEPDGEQKLSSEMTTHTNEKEDTKFIEVPGELEWKDGKKPADTDKVTVGVEYEKDGKTMIGDLITVEIGEEKNPCKHDGDNPFREFETADPYPSHGVYCEKCGKRLGMEECDLDYERTRPVRTGMIREFCTKCNYSSIVRCSHEDLIVTRPLDLYKHYDLCSLCLHSFTSTIETHDPVFEALNEHKHRISCSKCGMDTVDSHHHTRLYKKYEYSRMWNCYYVWYEDSCLYCGATVEGYIPYLTGASNWWIDFEPVFKKLVQGSLPSSFYWHEPDNYDRLEAMTIGFLLMPLYEYKDPDTGFSRAATLTFDMQKFLKTPGQDVRAFDKKGNEITGKKIPENLTRRSIGALLGTEDGDMGTPETEICYFDLTGLDEIHYALDWQMVEELEDGEHTITMLFYDRNEEGEIRNPSAVNFTFTVSTVRDKDGNDVKVATRPAADGTMSGEDSSPVYMKLSADSVPWTGKAVVPPAALLETPMGVELPEDQYSLSYYRVGDDAGTQLIPIAKDRITDVGVYRVVADPKEGSGLSGTAGAQFRVAYDLSSAGLSAQIEAVPDQEYTGYGVEPGLKVTVTVNGEKLVLKPHNAWTTAGEDGTSAFTQGKAGDYSVKYKNNIRVGKASFEVTGEGLFTGVLTGEFNITGSPDLAHAVFGEIPDRKYTGKEIRPKAKVSIHDDLLIEGTDYELEYADNVNAGTAAILITGKDPYTGTAAVTFVINKAKPAISVADKTAVYTGRAVTSNAAKVTPGDKGAITYKYFSDAACKKALKSAPVNAGTWYVKATVAEDANYKSASAVAKITIKKAANPLRVAKASRTVKAKLDKKKKTTAKKTVSGLNVTKKGRGAITYKKVKVNRSAGQFTVNKKTGKITVKKGTKAGTYKVTVSATAAGNANYAASRTLKAVVTVKVVKKK